MDLSYSAAEEAFREKVRSFLAANLPPGWGTKSYVQPARDAQTEFLREWQRKLYDAGLLGPEWPREYGGQGASLIEKAIFNEEMAKFRAPYPLNIIGLINAGNTLIVHGTQEQKKRYLPKFSPARKSGARVSPSPAPDPTSPRCAPGRCCAATNSSSTARRCGPPTAISHRCACCWCAPIPPPPSIAGSAACWWT